MYRSTRYRLQALAAMARIIYMIPAAVVYLLVYLARRVGRWYIASQAESWPRADATVNSSYELDENQSVLSLNGWTDEDDDDDYFPRWAIAIQYSYRANGELHAGTYLLPDTYTEGDLASEAEKAWAGREIIVRYNPSRPEQSFFLEQDGAPGKPHIPRMLSYRPQVTDLSL